MMNSKAEISNAFNHHAIEYEHVAEVQHEIGERLIERLAYLMMQPMHVLDIGCGPGVLTHRLKRHYPKAHIVGLDFAHQMLKIANAKQPWRRKCSFVNADMATLPFATGQFDLIFSNQVIHWSDSLSALFREFNRVLRPGGCLMFSTLGPDTFRELRQAFKTVDGYTHVNDFLDMHHIGDCLLNEKFVDPVVDMDMLTAHYPSLSQLLYGLKSQGVRNIHAQRNPGLTGKRSWHAFEQAMTLLRTTDNQFPLTYEVVYGHAWKGMQRRTEQGIETFISVEQLKKSTRRNEST